MFSKSSNLFQFKFFNDKKIKDFFCGADSNYILIGYFFFYFYFYFLIFIFKDNGTVFFIWKKCKWGFRNWINYKSKKTTENKI
jgi:hypothetical protein